MRIISGQFKGRQLHAPANLPVRPTTDRAKEALFSYLQHRFELADISVLDLFAGTGNISYEFASRGCENIVAVDQNAGCCRFIRSTIAQIGINGMAVNQADVFAWLERNTGNFDIIFADPPYQLDRLKSLPGLILAKNMLKADGLLILEHPTNHNFSTENGFLEARNYGQSVFSIFTATEILS